MTMAFVARPSAFTARDTFVPFPPGMHVHFRDRMNVPIFNSPMKTVLSTQGFGVTVRIIVVPIRG
jgi:hypothetical protein